MFFPQMKPSAIVGQSLKFAATFLGVAMVAIDGAVFAGPLFRDGSRVFILQSEQENDDTAVLRVLDIGDRAGTAVIDQKQQIDYLTQRVREDGDLIAALRQELEYVKNYATSAAGEFSEKIADLNGERESLKGDNRLLAAAVETLKTRVSELVAQTADLEADKTHLIRELRSAGNDLFRYREAVGPLDQSASGGINDEIAEQLKLMEPEATPAPPPVVSAGPAVSDDHAASGNSVGREFSPREYAFRRLQFLTRGDNSL